MKVLLAKSPGASRELAGAVATIGTFDGVHVGHRALIETAVDRAREESRPSVVITFDPHPRSVIPGSHSPELLTTLAEKLSLFAALGVDAAVVIPFDRERSRQAPAEFVREEIARRLAPDHVFAGYDFRFGRDRAGDAGFLAAQGRELGFGMTTVGPVAIDGSPVKSTAIRQALRAGRVDEAARSLGRFYSVSGRVVTGEGRGRRLNARTANLGEIPADKLLPAKGVYALFAVAGGDGRMSPADETPRAAVANFGTRPTFGGGEPRLEVHLLDWEGDLVGRPLTVHFAARIRDELTFDGPESLAARIRLDRREAADLLDIRDQSFIFTAESQFDSLPADG